MELDAFSQLDRNDLFIIIKINALGQMGDQILVFIVFHQFLNHAQQYEKVHRSLLK